MRTLGVLALLVLSVAGVERGAQQGPGVPRDLQVVAAAQNTITWQRDQARGLVYRVYRSSSRTGTYSLLGTVPSDAFPDTPPTRGIYWYRVSAVAAGGAEGPWSEAVSSDHVLFSQTVGPAGSTLEPTTGTVRLDIPAGAVKAPTVFTLEQLLSPPAATPGRALVTRAFEIGPSGTRFRPHATLTLRYDLPAGFVPADAGHGTLGAQFWQPATSRWVRLGGGTVDTGTSTVTAKISHLSLWAAASFVLSHGGYSSATDLCRTCHDWHDGKSGTGLLKQTNQRVLCYSCHDGTAASTDVRAQFGEGTIGSSTQTSFHPVPQAADGIQLVCSDCHTSHKPPAEDTGLLRLAQGTDWLYSPPDAPIGNPFCYGCHGSGSTYPKPFGDHSQFDASAHNTIAAPAGAAGIVCLACHKPHGSTFPSLLTAQREDLCRSCHGADKFWTGVHVADQNKTCVDCHDVHGSSNAFALRTDVGGVTNFGNDPTSAGDLQKLETFCTTCHGVPPDPGVPGHPATGVAPTQLCTDCHYHGSTNPF